MLRARVRPRSRVMARLGLGPLGPGLGIDWGKVRAETKVGTR